MARSKVIYVVSHPEDSMPLACFTVKHECLAWVESSDHNDTEDWEIWAYPDNPVGFQKARKIPNPTKGHRDDD